MEIKNKKSFNLNDIPPETFGRSQKGQDSKVRACLDILNPVNKYYVEFGAADGEVSSNSWHLRVNEGWSGLLLEGGQSNPSINLQNEFLTVENICSVFKKYNVPPNPGFVSADTDGMDWHLIREILKEYRPSLIMVECNVRFSPTESIIQKYDPTWVWSGKTWYGSSPLAMKRMAEKHDYEVVGLYLDDLFLVDKNLLTCEIDEVELIQNLEIYLTHGNCEFDPKNFEEYE